MPPSAFDQLFTLSGSVQGNWIIGPTRLRKKAELAGMTRCRELEKAKKEHKLLDRKIMELDAPQHSAWMHGEKRMNRSAI